jgi:hypothetical protein
MVQDIGLKPPTRQREKSHFTFASYLPKNHLEKSKTLGWLFRQWKCGIHVTTLDLLDIIAGVSVDMLPFLYVKIPLSIKDLFFQQGNPFFALYMWLSFIAHKILETCRSITID